MGFFDQLMNGLKSNPERQQREANVSATKQRTDESAQKFDMDLFDHMQSMGALPVQGGMVKRPMYDTSAPPDMPDIHTLQKADPQRIFTHKDAAGNTIQWEVPDEQTQQRRALYKHMQDTMGPAQQQIRGAENENAAAAAGATELGKKRGENTASQENREAIGGTIPGDIGDLLPGFAGKKFLPSEADDITRAAGQYANYKSEAEARKNPAKKVTKSELSRDDNGNQTQINTYSDGTIEELPVKAKGVTAKTGANGQVTPYQKFEMDRANQNDAHGRAMVWQNKLDKLQEEEDKLSQENIAHGQEMREVGTQLQNGELTGVNAKNQAKRRMSTLQGLIDGNNQRVSTIHSQKNSALKIKSSIMAANGGAVGQEQAKADAPPKTANLAQVNAYAKKYGLDPAAAKKAFEDDGVQIVGQ